MTYRIGLILLIVFTFSQIFSQSNSTSSIQNAIFNNSESAPIFELQSIKIEKQNKKELSKLLKEGMPSRFAQKKELQISTESYGEYTFQNNGDRIWRIHLQGDNVNALTLKFDFFELSQGSTLFFYNPRKPKDFKKFTAEDNNLNGLFISPINKGKELIIGLYEPKGEINESELCISDVYHSYNFFGKLRQVIINNDAILFGLLAVILGLVFYTSKHKAFAGFYKVVPVLLLCYLIPALLKWPLGIVSEDSNLYFVASRYLLPASLILLCISIDLKGVFRLGPKAIIMFLAATFGIVIGGPLALLIFTGLFPDALGISPDDLWRGLSTVAGSWIGGGANQAAMKEVFEVSDDLFGTMIVIDVIVANIWMAFLLSGARVSDKIDKVLKADNSAITKLKDSVKSYSASVAKMPTTYHMYLLMAVAFGGVGISHFFADIIAPYFSQFSKTLIKYGLSSLMSGFFWLVVFATTIGVALSFTKAKRLEGVGASRWGSVFIYVLVATIGMKMNLGEIFSPENLPLFGIGIIWMLIHIIVLLGMAYLIKAPFFFVAVGSQANIGGAASAPVVASAFDIALAPVGVLMAVLGYALGTYGALICAWLMQMAVG